MPRFMEKKETPTESLDRALPGLGLYVRVILGVRVAFRTLRSNLLESIAPQLR